MATDQMNEGKVWDKRPTGADLALLVMVALYYGEISEGCAVEILGWRREKIREQLERIVPIGAVAKRVEDLERAIAAVLSVGQVVGSSKKLLERILVGGTANGK